jgi:hypothetical protein
VDSKRIASGQQEDSTTASGLVTAKAAAAGCVLQGALQAAELASHMDACMAQLRACMLSTSCSWPHDRRLAHRDFVDRLSPHLV